jgi:hypothetical protein
LEQRTLWLTGKEVRHVLAGLGLPTRQQVELLHAGLLVAVMFMLQALFERGLIFTNRWDRVAYRWPSRQDVEKLPPKIAYLCTPWNHADSLWPCRDVFDRLAPPGIRGQVPQRPGMLPVGAKRLGPGGLQGFEAVVDAMGERFTPLLHPSLTGIQLGAIGRYMHRGDAVRPPHVAARVGPPVIEHDSPPRGGKGVSPLASKELQAGAIPPGEKPAAALPRGRLDGRIQPTPCVPSIAYPGRPRPPRTPAAPIPALQAKAGLIHGPHAWPVPLGECEAEGMF